MSRRRTIRRNAGFLSAYFSRSLLRLAVGADGRSRQGRRWKDPFPLLQAVLLGLAAGCKGPTEVEELTTEMSKGARKQTGITRRVADTTLRSFLCKLKPQILSVLVTIVAYDAWRRKALRHRKDIGIPFGVLSLDGKYPSVSDTGDYEYLQVHHNEEGEETHGLVRTITCSLVTAVGRPVLGATPIPGDTNEKGCFEEAFASMVGTFGPLFAMVMYDAGAASRANADVVVAANKHYTFNIADPRWVMHQTLELLLRDHKPAARQEQSAGSKRVVREIYVRAVKPAQKNRTLWKHTRTIIKLVSTSYQDEIQTSQQTRYYVSSLESSELTPEQWLELIVLRWGVETVHQILDTRSGFDEDNHPWVHADAQGNLAVQLLRRLVYTLMTLYRHVTLRSDDERDAPWRKLMENIKDTLKWPIDEDFEGLRERAYAVPPALS